MLNKLQGWAKPYNSKKWHYFKRGVSLCRQWIYVGEVKKDCEFEICVECSKRLRRLNK